MANKARNIISIDREAKTVRCAIRRADGSNYEYNMPMGTLDRNTLVVLAGKLGYKLTKSPLKYTTRELVDIVYKICNGTPIPMPEPQPQPQPTGGTVPTIKVNKPNTGAIATNASGAIGEIIQSAIDNALEGFSPEIDEAKVNELIKASVAGALADMDNRITSLVPKVTQVHLSGGQVRTINGHKHFMFDKVLRAVDAGLSPWLTGSAGVGKSHMAEQIADALGLDFSAESFCSQSSKSDIRGYKDGHGLYHSVDFRNRFEQGGVYLLDEIDSANPNILLTLNSALSNGWMAFPDGKVKKHDKFVAIASANTYGNGATSEYVGRQVIDGSTVDRFVKFDVPIDEAMETGITNDLMDDKQAALVWLSLVRAARKNVSDNGLKVIISPRASYHGAKLLTAGFTYGECVEATFGFGLKPETRNKVMAGISIPTGGAK